MSDPLIPVTSFDALMADGRRVVWQSFRPASAAAGTKPTVYFTTLAAQPEAGGLTRCNLRTIGVQGLGHAVGLTVLAGTVEVILPGQPAQPVPVGSSLTIPARGAGLAAELTFAGETCSLQVVPDRNGAGLAGEVDRSGTVARGGEEGGDDDPPPPPTPGDGD